MKASRRSGRARNPTTWSGAASNSDLTTAAGITRQGYTFQTQLGLWMGMNHMNGRVEDAITGRMLSADPHVPDRPIPRATIATVMSTTIHCTLIDPSGFDGCQDNTCKQDGGGGTTDFTGGVSAAMYASMLSSGSYASLVGAGVAFNEDHDLSGLGVIGSITQTVTTNGTASDSETGAEASSTGTVNTAPSTGANGTPQDNTTTPSTSAPTGTAPGTDAPAAAGRRFEHAGDVITASADPSGADRAGSHPGAGGNRRRRDTPRQTAGDPKIHRNATAPRTTDAPLPTKRACQPLSKSDGTLYEMVLVVESHCSWPSQYSIKRTTRHANSAKRARCCTCSGVSKRLHMRLGVHKAKSESNRAALVLSAARQYLYGQRELVQTMERCAIKGWPDRKAALSVAFRIQHLFHERELLRLEYLSHQTSPDLWRSFTSISLVRERLQQAWKADDEETLRRSEAGYVAVQKEIDDLQRVLDPVALDGPLNMAKRDPEVSTLARALERKLRDFDETICHHRVNTISTSTSLRAASIERPHQLRSRHRHRLHDHSLRCDHQQEHPCKSPAIHRCPGRPSFIYFVRSRA